jgi:uncharacterized lipoprotein YmbA
VRYVMIFILLAACGAEPVRYAVPLPPATGRVGVNVRSLEVRDATLPLYAGLEEIHVELADGGIVADTSTLWADDPQRGLTQGLASRLAGLTTARVAAEPWPLEDLPDARLEVRVGTLLAGADGQLYLSGQYFVARAEGADRAGRFAFAVPYQPGNVSSIAVAQGRAIDLLARQIAREALGAAGV